MPFYVRIPTKPWQPKAYRAWSKLKAKLVGRVYPRASQAVAFAIRHDTALAEVQAKQSAYAGVPEDQFEVVE